MPHTEVAGEREHDESHIRSSREIRCGVGDALLQQLPNFRRLKKSPTANPSTSLKLDVAPIERRHEACGNSCGPNDGELRLAVIEVGCVNEQVEVAFRIEILEL